jgi:hypothetical protein
VKDKSENNSPPDEEFSKEKFLFAPNNKGKKQKKNHAELLSEGSSVGNLTALCMRAGPASGWLKQSMSGSRMTW